MGQTQSFGLSSTLASTIWHCKLVIVLFFSQPRFRRRLLDNRTKAEIENLYSILTLQKLQLFLQYIVHTKSFSPPNFQLVIVLNLYYVRVYNEKILTLWTFHDNVCFINLTQSVAYPASYSVYPTASFLWMNQRNSTHIQDVFHFIQLLHFSRWIIWILYSVLDSVYPIASFLWMNHNSRMYKSLSVVWSSNNHQILINNSY
jgi:hypothetical protein